MAQAYNPSYSEGREQEDPVWNLAPKQIAPETLSQKKKKSSQKRAGGVAQALRAPSVPTPVLQK
jgi:hypothetical protein